MNESLEGYGEKEPDKDTITLREKVIDTCLFLYDTGYFIGTWGNIAVKVEEGLLITPSRVPYDCMTPDDLVVVSWDGEKIKGHRSSSSEMHVHRLLLINRQEFVTSIHIHSIAATALSCTHQSLPVNTEEMAQIIGGEVSCTNYIPGGRHLDLAHEVCEKIGAKSAAVLIANHGAVVCGSALDDTVLACQVLEKASKIYLMTTSVNRCIPISQKMVEEEHYRYHFKYGKENS